MRDYKILLADGDFKSLQEMGRYLGSTSEALKSGPDEDIVNLLKIMSHDIREPLVSMVATLKLLNRGSCGKMGEEVADKIKKILSNATRLTAIAEEHLGRTFAANEEFEIEGEPLYLIQDIINPVLEELSPELKDRPIEMDGQLNSPFTNQIFAKGNKLWLKTIFRNLIRNAIKRSGKRGRIAIGFENKGSSYRLNVYNEGKTIPDQCRDRLFTKFGCIGNSGNGNGNDNGMGLGLYLIRKIIQKQGGKIWYEAREHGSNFVFTLPADNS